MSVQTRPLHGESALWITDKTGAAFFRASCSTAYVAPEMRDLQRHIDRAKVDRRAYAFLDADSARIERVDGPAVTSTREPGAAADVFTDDELLAELLGP